MSMSDAGANQINVPSDAPIGVYRTPNRNPEFDTQSKDVTTGGGGNVVNSPGSIGVVTGGVGAPVNRD